MPALAVTSHLWNFTIWWWFSSK